MTGTESSKRTNWFLEAPPSVQIGVSGIVLGLFSAFTAMALVRAGLWGPHLYVLEGMAILGFLAWFPVSMIVGSLEELGILPGREG